MQPSSRSPIRYSPGERSLSNSSNFGEVGDEQRAEEVHFHVRKDGEGLENPVEGFREVVDGRRRVGGRRGGYGRGRERGARGEGPHSRAGLNKESDVLEGRLPERKWSEAGDEAADDGGLRGVRSRGLGEVVRDLGEVREGVEDHVIGVKIVEGGSCLRREGREFRRRRDGGSGFCLG